MKRGLILSLLCFWGVFLLLGCDKLFIPQKGQKKDASSAALTVKGPIVAKINNIPISLQDLNEELEAFNSLMAANNKLEAKITTHEQKVNYLKNEMVRRTLLYQKAQDEGLDRKDNVQRALEKTKMELLVMELLRQEADKINVTAKEVEDYYETYKDQLKEPEERQIREIMVPTEQEAKDVMIQLLQGADFSTLAREKSKAPSSGNGGDLGFVKIGEKSAQFEAAAFSDTLEAGKVSSIFKDTDGYYILKLEAQRGGKQRQLADVREDIKRALTFLKQQKTIEDLISKLSRESKIEIYEGEIK